MPYFSIQTNRPIDPTTLQELSLKASSFAADLVGKPEAYVYSQWSASGSFERRRAVL